MATKLKWKCGTCGAEFEATPALILLGGHWCPECYIPQKEWNYDEVAKTNPFFAQVWYPNHTKEENNLYEFDELFHIDGVEWDDIKRKFCRIAYKRTVRSYDFTVHFLFT